MTSYRRNHQKSVPLFWVCVHGGGSFSQSTFRLVFVCVAPNCHRMTKAGTLAVHAKQKLLQEKERRDKPEKKQGAVYMHWGPGRQL